MDSAADGKLASTMAAVAQLDRIDVAWDYQARIRVLRNFSVEGIESPLRMSGYRRGLQINVGFANYDNLEQEILQPDSVLRTEPLDLAVLALWLDRLPMAFDKAGLFQAQAVRSYVFTLLDQLRDQTACTIAINTFLAPSHTVDRWSGAPALADLNRDLRARCQADSRFYLVDFDQLSVDIGSEQALDRRFGMMYQAPLAHKFLARWAEQLAQAVAALKGMTRKVLVLDCDNTLWGGIIGEDGMAGIQLNPNDYPGNAFHAFQRQVLEIERQGVLIALCSKNNEADVLEVVDHHANCLLRREHLAAWRINWQDKAANLQSLATELNLGLESFVYVDDSSLECERIRSALPMVDTFQLPDSPYQITTVLSQYLGFRKLLTTSEDFQRTALYHAEQHRQTQARQAASLDEYLTSLDLEAEVGPATLDELPRAAQLTQKTNQFNLTTCRYSLGQLSELAERPDYLVLILKVKDRFGDYGLTGLAILQSDNKTVVIDTLLLSCRILGRRLEDAFLIESLDWAARTWGIRAVRAEYRPTAKNSQVQQFYDQRGFQRRDETPTGVIYFKGPEPPHPVEPIDFIRIHRR